MRRHAGRTRCLILTGLISLIGMGCPINKGHINPYDPLGPVLTYSSSCLNGRWSASQIDSSVGTPQYFAVINASTSFTVQDGATGITQSVCISINLADFPRPSSISRAYINGTFACGFNTIISILNAPFDSATTYSNLPSNTFMSNRQVLWNASGGCTYIQTVEVTPLVKAWFDGGKPNYGFFISGTSSGGPTGVNAEYFGPGESLRLIIEYHPE
jgi:hypothetical protein